MRLSILTKKQTIKTQKIAQIKQRRKKQACASSVKAKELLSTTLHTENSKICFFFYKILARESGFYFLDIKMKYFQNRRFCRLFKKSVL